MAPVVRLLLDRVLPWVALVHALLFALFWLTNGSFYAQTNDFLTGMLKSRMDYISIALWISGAIGAASLALILLARLRPETRAAGWVIGLFAVFAVLYLAFFYASFGVLFKESPVQSIRLGYLLSYYRVFIDVLLLLGAAAAGGLLLRGYFTQHPAAGRLPIMALAVVALAVMWAIPLLLPPGSVYRGALPPKPKIIAHRGAAMLAPENTIASAQRAAELGVYGLETDIHISQDGQPFLMHDDTLFRTTDVASVFPGRQGARAETFTLAEVRQLNAGRWFIAQNPYKTVNGQAEALENQRVPTLAEELDIVKAHRLAFIFDLKQPPEGHPYRQAFFDIVLKQIQQYGIDAQVWYLVTPDELSVIRRAAPQMKPTAGIDYRRPPAADSLKSAGYQIVNSEYGLSTAQIRAYHQAGLWVNLWTVDEPWLYSRLWLLGVDSTTTNNSHTMLSLDHPVLGLSYSVYLAIWIIIGVLSIGLVLLFLR